MQRWCRVLLLGGVAAALWPAAPADSVAPGSRATIEDRRSAVAIDVDFAGVPRGAGHDVTLLPAAAGIEDTTTFASRPAHEEVTYRVDVSRVAGLRLLHDTLEFLDRGGIPRLRVAPPFVVGASGVPEPAAVRVSGCAVDTDPRPPWGRPPIDPGAATCEVTVRWDGARLDYPLVVDPAWTTTGDMVQTRRFFPIALTQAGQVLVASGSGYVGGQGFLSCIPTSELYDPKSQTWSVVGSKTDPCCATLVTLPDGKVLGVAVTPSAERYDPGTGKWSPAATPANTDVIQSVLLKDGRVLVIGVKQSQLYDPMADAWTASGDLNGEHEYATASVLNDGTVLVTGGLDLLGNPVLTAEIYDPGTGKWTHTGNLGQPRANHTATVLPGGKVLVAGGAGISPIAAAEIYDPATKVWTSAGALAQARVQPTANLLPNGRVLVAGGWVGPPLASAEVYDPTTNAWESAGNMTTARAFDSAVNLLSGDVLLAAGLSDTSGGLTSTELFHLQPQGVPCDAAGECSSGHCADGVCCDQDCGAACYACSASVKGTGADGVCGPVVAKADPNGRCPATQPTTCGDTGKCTGNGACEVYPAGLSCGQPPACTSAGRVSFACDGKGACAQTIAGCGAYACDSPTTCRQTCQSNADCSSSFECDVPTSTCVPRPPSCDGDHTIKNSDGTTVDCSPFECAGTTCKSSCASALDCVAPAACNRDGVCVPPSAALASDQGGGLCDAGGSTAGASGGAAAVLWLGTWLLLAGRRTRRGS